MDLYVSFFRRLNKHPVRTLAEGVILVSLFHALRFWVRQAGLYSALKVPVSLFSSAIGSDMLVGPLVEMVSALYHIQTWKQLLCVVLLLAGIVETVLALWLKKKKRNESIQRNVQTARRLNQIAVFIFIPAVFLPTVYDAPPTAMVSTVGFVLVYGSLRFIPRSFQFIALLLGLGFTAGCWADYFYQGEALALECRAPVMLTFTSPVSSETGCWVSSSSLYIVLAEGGPDNSRSKIIRRDLVSEIRFLERPRQ